MRLKIYCLMFSGKPLSFQAADALYATALQLVQKNEEETHIVHDDCTGVVSTDWNAVSLGHISGILFEADILTPRGQTNVEFIVRTFDLESSSSDAHKWN